MSTERAQAFLAAVAADPALRQRLGAVQSREQALSVMQAAGYGDVTSDDLKAVAPPQSEGELSEEALETAVGGVAQSLSYEQLIRSDVNLINFWKSVGL